MVHISDVSRERPTYPFCALTEDVSKEERAEVASYFDVP